MSLTSARSVGIARIMVGLAALLKAWVMAPVLLGLADSAAIRIPMASWLPALPAEAAMPVLATWVASALAFLAGWRTRPAGVLLSAVLLAVLLGDQQLYSNHLYLLLTVTALLTLAGAGAAPSLDARRAAGEPGRGPRVVAGAVTLLMLQVSIVYGFAAISKVNLAYLSGAVLNAFLGRGSILPLPDSARTFTVMAVLSWLSILAEGFLAVAFWSRGLRSVAVVVGVIFHLAIVLFVAPADELTVFALIMFALYVLHVRAADGADGADGAKVVS